MKDYACSLIALAISFSLTAQLPVGFKVDVMSDTSVSVVNKNTANPMALGGYFESNSVTGTAIKGVATGDDLIEGFGGHFISHGNEGRGVIGEATYSGSNGQTFGGFFRTVADNSFGVWTSTGHGVNSYGVVGESSGDDSHGVSGVARGRDGIGVSAYHNGETGYAVYAETKSGTNESNTAGYFYQENTYTNDPPIGMHGFGIVAISKSNNYDNAGVGVHATGGFAGVYGESLGTNPRNYHNYYTYGVYGKSIQGSGVRGDGAAFDFDAVGPGLDWHSSSSARWKTDILAIEDPIVKLEALQGVTFVWDEDHGGHSDIGFIAEEVGEILPEVVHYELNGTDASGMDYSRMTALIVEAAKAMRQEYLAMFGSMLDEMESHKAQVLGLKAMNTSLKAELKEYKSSNK